jgi:hypothetical protein
MADHDKTDEEGGRGPSRRSAEVKEFRAAGRGKPCPICGHPVDVAYRPFCSKRCADLDLGRWLREDYRIPAEEPPDGAEDGGEQGADVPRQEDGRS